MLVSVRTATRARSMPPRRERKPVAKRQARGPQAHVRPSRQEGAAGDPKKGDEDVRQDRALGVKKQRAASRQAAGRLQPRLPTFSPAAARRPPLPDARSRRRRRPVGRKARREPRAGRAAAVARGLRPEARRRRRASRDGPGRRDRRAASTRSASRRSSAPRRTTTDGDAARSPTTSAATTTAGGWTAWSAATSRWSSAWR